MERTYGHTKSTAERLTEIADAPQRIGGAFLRPARRPRYLGDAGALVYCVTPAGGIGAMIVNEGTFSLGSATCTVVEDGTPTVETITVKNSVSASIPGGILIGVIPLRDEENYGIVVGNCPAPAGSS